MNTYAKLIAAIILVAVGVLGMAVLRPGQGGGGGDPSPPPMSPTAPTPTLDVSASPAGTPFAPPALNQPFTSVFHGISLSGPAGWQARHATEPWTTTTTLPLFGSPYADAIYDESTDDLKFIGLASQALGGKDADQWVTATANDPEWDPACPLQTQPLTVDGATGVLGSFCPGRLLIAVVTTADRGYLIILYGVGDRRFFDEILATVQLDPSAAVDEAPR